MEYKVMATKGLTYRMEHVFVIVEVSMLLEGKKR